MKRTLFTLLLFVGLTPYTGGKSWAEAVVDTTPKGILHLDHPDRSGQVEQALAEANKRATHFLGRSLSYLPDVYIVDDSKSFKDAIGAAFPDWGAGAAVPYKHLIVIKSPDRFRLGRSLQELLIHEYAHLALADRVGLAPVPRWFNEGFSMMLSAEWGWADNLAMSRAAVFGQMMSLHEIDAVNGFSAAKAHVAYAESYLAVSYVFQEYSRNAASIFLDSLARGRSVDAALMGATGSNYADFDEEFRLYLEKRYNLTSLFLDTMWFWFALAVIVVVGGFLKYRRRRQYYKKWEREEQLQSTDFDYGDPDAPEQIDDDEPWRG